MRKIYLFIFLLFLAKGVFAQVDVRDTLFPVGWITYPSDVDWSVEKFPKKAVTIMKAPVDWVFDENQFTLTDLWDKLGDENEVKNPTNTDGGDLYGANFGARWKAFYDNENLYVCLKYMDKNLAADENSRSFEIMYQTKYYDRYEPGWQAAQSIKGKNYQYARYIRLGGGKAKIESAGLTEFASSDGAKGPNSWQLGIWGTNANVTGDPPVVVWDVDAENTIWCTIQFNFAKHMYYLNDVKGLDTVTNRVAFDPTQIDTISFDVKSNALKETQKVEYFWNSNTNDGFEAVYYNGYLVFGDKVLGIHKPVANTQSAYAYMTTGNVLKLKGISNANVDVYSLLGQRMKSARNVSELNMNDLTKGLYIVRINNTYSQKVMVR
ncbi:MAG: T9SS type A sorting domain-containing protein [Bacteroidales bacterium]